MTVSTINEIRYLKRDQTLKESLILKNYYTDIINQYGIDVTYFKQNTEYPKIINPTLSAMENIIYGENADIGYSLSADVVLYLEVEQNIFSFNQQGSQPDQHYIGSMMIDTFASAFAQYLGGNDEFNTNLNLSGVVNNYSVTLSSDFNIDGLSGVIMNEFDLSGTPSGIYTPTISDLDPTFSREVPINPYIKDSKNLNIVDDEHTVAFIGEYDSDLDLSGNGTITSTLSGSLLYASVNSVNRYVNMIKPDVGDIIRINMFDDVNFEEYEVTQVYDRQLIDGGVNPLLHKYLYRMDMIRRTPSNENISGDYDNMEPYAKELLDVVEKTNHAQSIISNEVYDYDEHNNIDDIYGGYGSTDSTPPDVDQYVSGVTVDENVVIHSFIDNSSLYTDGIDIFYTNYDGIESKLSAFGVATVPDDVPTELMYLKSDGVDLYFMNKNSEVVALTDNDGTGYTQIPLNTKLYDFDNDSEVSGLFYKFASSATVLYTDGINLYVRNDNDVITQMTDN